MPRPIKRPGIALGRSVCRIGSQTLRQLCLCDRTDHERVEGRDLEERGLLAEPAQEIAFLAGQYDRPSLLRRDREAIGHIGPDELIGVIPVGEHAEVVGDRLIVLFLIRLDRQLHPSTLEADQRRIATLMIPEHRLAGVDVADADLELVAQHQLEVGGVEL